MQDKQDCRRKTWSICEDKKTTKQKKQTVQSTEVARKQLLLG